MLWEMEFGRMELAVALVASSLSIHLVRSVHASVVVAAALESE